MRPQFFGSRQEFWSLCAAALVRLSRMGRIVESIRERRKNMKKDETPKELKDIGWIL